MLTTAGATRSTMSAKLSAAGRRPPAMPCHQRRRQDDQQQPATAPRRSCASWPARCAEGRPSPSSSRFSARKPQRLSRRLIRPRMRRPGARPRDANSLSLMPRKSILLVSRASAEARWRCPNCICRQLRSSQTRPTPARPRAGRRRAAARWPARAPAPPPVSWPPGESAQSRPSSTSTRAKAVARSVIAPPPLPLSRQLVVRGPAAGRSPAGTPGPARARRYRRPTGAGRAADRPGYSSVVSAWPLSRWRASSVSSGAGRPHRVRSLAASRSDRPACGLRSAGGVAACSTERQCRAVTEEAEELAVRRQHEAGRCRRPAPRDRPASSGRR